MTEKPTCWNCKWWDEIARSDPAIAEGWCDVKLPPHIHKGGATQINKTVKDYCCALHQFQPKEQPHD